MPCNSVLRVHKPACKRAKARCPRSKKKLTPPLHGEIRAQNKRKHDTNQPPGHVVSQRCATPSRHPSGPSATSASLSTTALQAALTNGYVLPHTFGLWSGFFPTHLGPSHFFRISCNGSCLQPHTTPFDAFRLDFSVDEGPLLFWLRLEFFTVVPFLHQTLKASCVLQR